jgi:hypothetical protein
MTNQQLLSLAGELVKSINSSLLASPPPSTEQTGKDVCYLGLNGEDGIDDVVYCKDLPEGLRAMVGSWYLDPERHVMECIAFVTLSSLIIIGLLPRLSQYPKSNATKSTPPLSIKVTTFIIYAVQLIYKLNGYPGKVLFMAMPCNVLWTMWACLCFLPMSAQTMHIIYQLIVPYTSLAIVAVATPDTSDLTMFLEVPFFFFMHYALIFYPIYLMRSGHISVLPLTVASNKDGLVVNFMKWWVLACAYFALFYFGVAAPLSLKYGINLNYMLSPPPNPGDMVSGPNFRLQSTICCSAAFFFVQFLANVAEVFGKSISKKKDD